MDKIKIVFLHPCINNANQMADYLCIDDQKLRERFVWDENDPDYVIATEHIYTKKKYFNMFKKYYKKSSAVFIFHGGEAIYPDMNIFDYAIVYSEKMTDGDRIIKMPAEKFFHRNNELGKNKLTEDEAQESLKEKKFCNFIYSNPKAHPFRDELFYAVSSYKKVDSLGAHLNNTSVRPTRSNEDWYNLSIEQKSGYKFTIACENALFEGYTSEKIMGTFKAHSIPIYFGNPYVAENFNPEAFINCHDYNSIDEVVTRVKEIDEDDKLWIKMVTSPWKTEDQENKYVEHIDEYNKFINNIFAQDKKAALRRPFGTHTNLYYKWFFRKLGSQRTFSELIHAVFSRINNLLKSIFVYK